MPDLRSLLSAAAADAQPASQPPFSSLRARASRRAARRRTAAVLAVAAVLVVGSVAVAQGLGGGTSRPAAVPCVTPSQTTDVLAAIPASGTVTVDVHPGDYLTVGWASCAESGTFTVPVQSKAMLSGLYRTSGVLDSARVLVFGVGTTTVTGDGSAGSHGTLLLRSTYRPEPVGMSSASPFPTNEPQYAGPELCKAGDVADAAGRLTKTVTYEDGLHLLEPPGDVRSRWTKAEILATASQGDVRLTTPHVTAVFGLLTAENYGGGHRLPRWIVYDCDLPGGQRGEGGPAPSQPTPAPGTSPTPFGVTHGVGLDLFDENKHAVYQLSYAWLDDATLAQQFVEVPFARTHQDSADGRQIGISYPAYDCATFSHLDVNERDATSPVHVKVWLRVTAQVPCDPHGTREAAIGLRFPLGDRQLVRGEG
jgi:hypothetical protein